MDYEQFKERIEEDLHQALADHGIDANFSQHHVEKLNASYDALSVTPEGSHIGVNANLSAMFEAIEKGQDYNEVVSRASESIIAGIENTPEINVEDLTNYDEMKSKQQWKLFPLIVMLRCLRMFLMSRWRIWQLYIV